jgi:signal transduction histidine kinase
MRSLTLKLTLAFLLVGVIGALLVALIIGVRTQRDFDRFLSETYQRELVGTLAEYYQQHGGWEGIDAILVRSSDRRRDGREFVPVPVVLTDADGVVVRGGRRYQNGQRLTAQQLRRGLAVEVAGETVGRVVLDIAPAGVFQPADAPPDSPEAGFLTSVRQATLLSALVAAGIALLLGLLLARTISRPVKQLTDATRRVAHGELGLQVPVQTRDELGELATSFNQMSADLARAADQRRQMTADIAHELRTPLSVILGYTEALSDNKLAGTTEVYDTMYGEAQLLGHLIEELRTLSLADADELPLNRQDCRPEALLERIIAAQAPLAAEKGIALRAQPSADLPAVNVDPERMAQVLGNLVSNALRYTPQGGEVVLTAEKQNGGVALSVRDTGPGIAPEDLPRVFDRFYRGDRSRQQTQGESGLGLAIAKSLVEAHGGSIRVESTPGQGATFIVTLPPASPE